MRQTTYPKGVINGRKWFIVDVKDCILGRVAAQIAKMINGKGDVMYSPFLNNGPGVIVINAKYIKLTGNKLNKNFFWHTGFAGGIKKITIKERLNSKNPCIVLSKAVERMLPKGPLGRLKIKNLRIFSDDSHIHQSINPVIWDLAGQNSKNKREVL